MSVPFFAFVSSSIFRMKGVGWDQSMPGYFGAFGSKNQGICSPEREVSWMVQWSMSGVETTW